MKKCVCALFFLLLSTPLFAETITLNADIYWNVRDVSACLNWTDRLENEETEFSITLSQVESYLGEDCNPGYDVWKGEKVIDRETRGFTFDGTVSLEKHINHFRDETFYRLTLTVGEHGSEKSSRTLDLPSLDPKAEYSVEGDTLSFEGLELTPMLRVSV